MSLGRMATALAVLVGLVACKQLAPTKEAAGPRDGAVSCASLAGLALDDTIITRAEAVAAGAFVLPWQPSPRDMPRGDYSKLPAFCRVAGSTSPAPDSEIKFEVWMPAKGWNGKFVGVGNGGAAGFFFYGAMADPLARGYAVASTNTGHDGPIDDFGFALGHPEKLTDFAWRAVHEMTVKAKAVIAAYYGASPRTSFWDGCSTGGRQGLKEAQRFPEDYDAIHAGAPANDWVRLMAYGVLVQRVMTDPAGALPPGKLDLIKRAAIAACDERDGVKDGVVNEPLKCDFDPAQLRCGARDKPDCLTAAQVKGARRVYRGVVSARTGEPIFPGPQPGGEPAWAAYRPEVFAIGANYWRNVIVGDPHRDIGSFEADKDVARGEAMEAGALTANDPDLSAFLARGGKLLLWQGWTDALVPPRSTIAYYDRVLARLGAERVKDQVRLFMAPGVDHCIGGEGAWQVDYLGALAQWVDTGKAPDVLYASRPLEAGASRTRPLCLYPQVAKYKGSGSTEEAANFSCIPGEAVAAQPGRR